MIIFRSFSFLICSLNAVNCPLNTALLHPTNSDNSEYFKNFSWDFLFGPYVTSGMLISRYGIFSCLSVTDLLCPGLRGGIVVVQLPSRGPALRSPVVAAHLAPLACTVPWSLRKFMSIESVLLSNHFILCHPLLLTAQFSSVQFSHSVVSYSLWPHGLQHTRLPCPSPTPRAWSNSHPCYQ